VPFWQPLRWLDRGVKDLLVSTGPSLAHGAVMILGSGMIMLAGWFYLPLLAGAFTGFLLVAPILATGLYELSRRIGRGETPGLADALSVWRRAGRGPLVFGLVLAGVGTAWVLVSVLTLATMTPEPVRGLASFFSVSVFRAADSAERAHLFWLWLMAGGLLAALVFAAAAVSVPLLVDRTIGVREAVLASIEAVAQNPGAMVLWACLILVGTAIGLVTAIGLAVIWPILGHATWHAYLDLVDAGSVPPRGAHTVFARPERAR
jgi:uncharacterized membrane protein